MQLAQAAAEELRVPLEQIRDGARRHGHLPERRHDGRQRHDAANGAGRAAGGRGRSQIAASSGRPRSGDVEADAIEARDGKVIDAASDQSIDVRRAGEGRRACRSGLPQPAPGDVQLTPVAEWKTLGTEQPAPLARDKVTGPASVSVRYQAAGHAVRQSAAVAEVSREADVGRSCAGEGDGRIVVALQDGEFVGVVGADRVRRRASDRGRRENGEVGAKSRCRRATSCTTICANMPMAACRTIRLPTESRRRRNRCRRRTRSPTCSTRRWSRGRQWPSGRTAN